MISIVVLKSTVPVGTAARVRAIVASAPHQQKRAAEFAGDGRAA